MSSLDDLEEQFRNALGFSDHVYSLMCSLLPSQDELSFGEIKISGYPFQDEHQLNAHKNELGWAFFCRIEATLEAFLERLQCDKKKAIDLLNKSSEVSQDEKDLFKAALELRNVLLHGDGDQRLLRKSLQHLRITDDTEPQITFTDMKCYAELFIKVGSIIRSSLQAQQGIQADSPASGGSAT